MAGATAYGHIHAEAFMLMTYRSDDGSEEEVIWNSRDGVTPFVITLRSGKAASHVNWADDTYSPDFNPPPGSRMFVDLTSERAHELARANAERFWDMPGCPASESGRWRTKLALAKELKREYLIPGAPDLVEVPE